jgi:hypothetical protein
VGIFPPIFLIIKYFNDNNIIINEKEELL